MALGGHIFVRSVWKHFAKTWCTTVLINCTWAKKEGLGLTSPYAHTAPTLGYILSVLQALSRPGPEFWVMGMITLHLPQPSGLLDGAASGTASESSAEEGGYLLQLLTQVGLLMTRPFRVGQQNKKRQRMILLVFCQFMNENKGQNLYDHVQWVK